MAIDTYQFKLYSNNNLEYKYLVTFSKLCATIQKLMDGTIQGWYQSNFFQEHSDYVVRAMYFPIDWSKYYPVYTQNYKDANIRLGKVSTTIDGFSLDYQNGPVKVIEKQIDRYFNNFLDFEPYTKIKLFIPFFNEITLEPQMVYGKTLTVYVSIDFDSGHSTAYIYADNILIETENGQLGFNLPMGRTNAQEQERAHILNALQLIGTIGAAGMATAFGPAGSTIAASTLLSGTAKYIASEMSSNVNRMTGYTGSDGTKNFLCIDKDIKLIYERPTNVKYPNYHLVGKPTEQAFNDMTNLTGFVQVSEIHFNPKGEKIRMDEIDEIVSLLKSGVVL